MEVFDMFDFPARPQFINAGISLTLYMRIDASSAVYITV